MDSKDILDVLEGACFHDAETNPQLDIFLQKILIRFYLHLWSIEVGDQGGSVSIKITVIKSEVKAMLWFKLCLVQMIPLIWWIVLTKDENKNKFRILTSTDKLPIFFKYKLYGVQEEWHRKSSSEKLWETFLS